MTAKDLKSLRTNLGLSITDLAKALKCHFTLISLWEREKSPIPEKRVDQLRKFFQSKMSEKTIPTLKEKIYIDKPDVTTFQVTTLELGPVTLRAIEDMIRKATFEIQLSIGAADPMMRLRREEVKEDIQRGEEYRRKTQDILSKGKS